MKWILATLIGLAFGAWALLFGQQFQIAPSPFQIGSVSPYDDHPGLLMVPAREARLRAAMPKIADHDNDWAGLYYTEDEMPPAYQFDGGGFHSVHYNVSVGRRDSVGNAFEFPWRHPGGFDHCAHYTWKVLQLPKGGRVSVFGNGPIWDWTFPVGTRFVEALSYADRLKVFELRTRQKRANGTWETKRYFPARDPALVVRSSTYTLRDSLHPVAAFPTLSAEIDTVEGGRDFTELVETKWAPRADKPGAVVPVGYQGAFAVKNCNNCHDSTGREARSFDQGRDWYGRARGSFTEGIISFHPADPSTISGNGFQVQMRTNARLQAILKR